MKRQTVMYFILFVLDVLALSWMFATWREFWVVRKSHELLRFGFAAGWFFLLFIALGYFTYSAEKRKGKLTRKVALYEWIEERGWRFE